MRHDPNLCNVAQGLVSCLFLFDGVFLKARCAGLQAPADHYVTTPSQPAESRHLTLSDSASQQSSRYARFMPAPPVTLLPRKLLDRKHRLTSLSAGQGQRLETGSVAVRAQRRGHVTVILLARIESQVESRRR